MATDALDSMPELEELSAWETPDGVKKIADILHGPNGLATREGILNGTKRIHYFRGDKLREFLTKKNSDGSEAIAPGKKEAMKIGQALIKFRLIVRAERPDESKKQNLIMSRTQQYDIEGYYVWVYEGSQKRKYVMSMLLVCAFLTCVCFPIWPMWAKLGAWYLSVTLLIIMFLFVILRLFVFLFFWTFGQDIWLFPNIFDETLGVADSFRPAISVKKTPPGEGAYRAAFVVAVAAFAYWAEQQPSDWESLMDAQRQIMDDIYQARLLTDYSQEAKENIDKVKMPSLEDLMADVDEDEVAEQQRLDAYLENLLEGDGEEDDEESKKAKKEGAVESVQEQEQHEENEKDDE